MKINTVFFFAVVTLLIISCSAGNEFFVDPSGNDSGPGTREAPFASIEKARQSVREILEGEQSSDITVWLAGGTYHLESPLEFTPDDSGENGFSIVYRACPGEMPVISGGIQLQNWHEEKDETWTAAVDPSLKLKSIRELFINGTRAIRARTPDEGFLRVKQAGPDKRTSFYFDEKDFPVPKNSANVELILFHDWSISRIRALEINAAECLLSAVDSIGARNPSFFTIDHWEPHPRYYLENSLDFLDRENEWFFDGKAGKVHLRLPPGIKPEDCSITIPVSEGLLQLAGKPDNPVQNIRFEGLTFSHSSWQIPERGYSGIQATHFDPRPGELEQPVVGAAVQSAWAKNCEFLDCEFSHLGGAGLWLGSGSCHCLVRNSVFNDISGNGLMIGEGNSRQVNGESWWETSPEQVARGNRIESCTITGCGRQFYGAVGVWCGLVADTIIRKNEIANLPYTGISVGWMWDPQPTPCRNNLIEQNHIHHIMQVLSDGGGIYMLGLQPGSRLTGNRIHDVMINAGKAESNGMFLDEGSTGLVIAGNLIYNIARSPLRFHKAETNLVRENYLFCSGDNPPVRYNSTPEENIELKDNFVFSEISEGNFKHILQKTISEWPE